MTKQLKTKKIVFKAKNFEDRIALEEEIKKILGDNLILNRQAGHEIVGTPKELGNLMLSDTSTIFGCRTVTEIPKKKDDKKNKKADK